MEDATTVSPEGGLVDAWDTAGAASTGADGDSGSSIFSGWVLALLILLVLTCCFATGCSRHLIKYVVDPRRGPHKYILLFLICLFIPGPYFHDAILATFKGPISDRMGLSSAQYASLFAVSSMTGIFFGPGGAVISHIGRTRSAVIASFFAACGSALTTLGFCWGHLGVMLIGRFIFWFALNGLLMVQTILTYDMFKGKDLNLAMTMIVCSIRIGGSASYPLSGPLLHRLGVRNSLWFTVLLVFGAFCATLVFAKLFRGTEIARAIWPMLQTRATNNGFSLRLLRDVPCSVFFFLCGLAAVWGAVFPFEVVGDDMLQKEFGYTDDEAGLIIAICPMISVLSPVIGPFLGTKLYQKLAGCTAGLVTLICAFTLIASRAALTGIVLVGVGYCISICSFYSTLPMFVTTQVPEESGKTITSLVVGLNMACSGISMIVSNLAIGFITDQSSYLWACVFLAFMGAWGLLSMGLAIALHRPRAEPAAAQPERDSPADDVSDRSESSSVVVSASFNVTDTY